MVEFYVGKTKKYQAVISPSEWNRARSDKITRAKTVNFGAKGYEHYKDKIGHYSNLDHGDKVRRRHYRERHSKVMKGNTPSYKIKYTPAWFSWHYLW